MAYQFFTADFHFFLQTFASAINTFPSGKRKQKCLAFLRVYRTENAWKKCHFCVHLCRILCTDLQPFTSWHFRIGDRQKIKPKKNWKEWKRKRGKNTTYTFHLSSSEVYVLFTLTTSVSVSRIFSQLIFSAFFREKSQCGQKHVEKIQFHFSCTVYQLVTSAAVKNTIN